MFGKEKSFSDLCIAVFENGEKRKSSKTHQIFKIFLRKNLESSKERTTFVIANWNKENAARLFLMKKNKKLFQ